MILLTRFYQQLFTAWVVVALIWLWVTLVIANFYPLYDGGFKMIWAVLARRQGIEEKADSGVTSPREAAGPEHPEEAGKGGEFVNEGSLKSSTGVDVTQHLK